MILPLFIEIDQSPQLTSTYPSTHLPTMMALPNSSSVPSFNPPPNCTPLPSPTSYLSAELTAIIMMNRTTSHPNISFALASPTAAISPVSACSPTSSVTGLSSPSTPLADLSPSPITLPPPAAAGSAKSKVRKTFFSRTASFTSSSFFSSSSSTTASSPLAADGLTTTTTTTAAAVAVSTSTVTTTTAPTSPSSSSHADDSSSDSIFKSLTRPLASFYSSLRISCLPSDSQAAAARQRFEEKQKQLPISPPPASMSDTEMGSLAELRRKRESVRRVTMAANGVTLGDIREQGRVSRISRVSRHSYTHSRRSTTSRSSRQSHNRHSRSSKGTPSSPSSPGLVKHELETGELRFEEEEWLDVGEGDDEEEEDEEDVESEDEVTMVCFNASPLVLVDHRSITPVSRLDIDGEKQQIRRVLQRTSAPINCSFRQLTLEHLTEELLHQPDILHLSGHGLHCADGTYALALEHDNGSVSLLSMPSLAGLLSVIPLPRLVVILACHSESAGRVFIDAGADYCVCVRASERVLDSAAKYFTRFFYQALLAGYTIQQSFNIGSKAVESAFDSQKKDQPAASTATTGAGERGTLVAASGAMKECDKFVLLKSDVAVSSQVLFSRRHRRGRSGGNSGCASPIRQSPSLSSISIRPSRACPLSPVSSSPFPLSPPVPLSPTHSSFHSNLPSCPSTIIGREREVQRCVHLLLNHRLVNLYGKEKAGKTSVGLMAAHWLREREKYEGGCFYVSMRGIRGMNGKSEGVEESEAEVKERETRLLSHLVYVLGLEECAIKSLRQLYRVIRDWDLLLVFDDCTSSAAYTFLLSLLVSTTRPRMLALSSSDARHYLTLDSHQHCASMEVGALSTSGAVALIRRLCVENGWWMVDSEMQRLALVCECNAYRIVVRMRRQAMVERERQEALGGGGNGGVASVEEAKEEVNGGVMDVSVNGTASMSDCSASVRGADGVGEVDEVERVSEAGGQSEAVKSSAGRRRMMEVCDFDDVLDVDQLQHV